MCLYTVHCWTFQPETTDRLNVGRDPKREFHGIKSGDQ